MSLTQTTQAVPNGGYVHSEIIVQSEEEIPVSGSSMSMRSLNISMAISQDLSRCGGLILKTECMANQE
jgi:hypothetical protein